MLDFGYDESGEGNILLVSCQVGKVRRLRRFSRKWRDVLKNANVEYFHAKDYDNLTHGPFKGLSRKQRFKLVGKLAALIRDFMDAGFTARIDRKVYTAETTADQRSRYGSAYCYAVQATVMAAHLFMETKDKEDGANILIENGHRNVGDVIDKLNGLKREDQYLRVYIKSCGGGWKKDHPILQAADMLAYSEWQRINQTGRDMFDALNVDGSPYQPLLFDCDAKLLRATRKGITAFRAHKKAIWESGSNRGKL